MSEITFTDNLKPMKGIVSFYIGINIMLLLIFKILSEDFSEKL